MATAARLAAAAAPDPELDPEGLRSSAYGFLVWRRPRPLQPLVECVERKFRPLAEVGLAGESPAPASRSRWTMKGVRRGSDAGQGSRSGSGHLAVSGRDVVVP